MVCVVDQIVVGLKSQGNLVGRKIHSHARRRNKG